MEKLPLQTTAEKPDIPQEKTDELLKKPDTTEKGPALIAHEKISEIQDRVRKILDTKFPTKEAGERDRLVTEIVNHVEARENSILQNRPDEKSEGAETTAQLQDLPDEALIIATAASVLKQESGSIEDLHRTLGHLGIRFFRTYAPPKPELVAQMRSIYESNYADKPEAFRKAILEKFDAGTKDPETSFNVLSIDGEIIGFNMISLSFATEIKDLIKEILGKKEAGYFGAVNVAPKFQGFRLGELLLETTFSMASNNVEAYCTPEAPITQRYIEDYGFVATNMVELESERGLRIYKENAKNSSDYITKGSFLSEEDIVSCAGESKEKICKKVWHKKTPLLRRSSYPEKTFRVVIRKSLSEIPFDQIGEEHLTRLFKHNGGYYAVFERPGL